MGVDVMPMTTLDAIVPALAQANALPQNVLTLLK
jgi:hypothetical protein